MITLAKPLSRIALFTLGISVGIVLTIFPTLNQFDASTKEQNTIYGQALADAVAREALEPAFQNNLLGLRAIIQSIAHAPKVVRVTIHDVDNNTLVQAGASTHETIKNTQSFEASIVLHDSITGFVSVQIEVKPSYKNQILTFYLCLCAFGVILFIASLIRNNNLEIDLSRIKKIFESETKIVDSNSEEIEPSTNIDEDDEIEKAEEAPAKPEAYAAICVKNVAVLQQQLNGDTFRKTFCSVEDLLGRVGRAYGALRCDWDHDRYILTFAGNTEKDAAFNAACAAHLALDLAGIIDRVPLDLSAQISLDKLSISRVKLPFVGLAADNEGQTCELLEGKVEYLNLGEADEARKLISNFVEPYATLLQKQMHQFKSDDQ